jgi:hypothetical protein
MADRAIRQSRKDSDGDITAIGDAGQYWSPVSKNDAIYHIESGVHRYYVPWETGSTWIRVVNGPSGKYLRTDRDDTSRNNLDDLPDC